MQKIKYWSKYIKLKMHFVIMSHYYDLHMTNKDTAKRDRRAKAILCVQSMIVIFLGCKQESKLKSKYDGYISEYRRRLISIPDKIADDEKDVHTIVMRSSCAQMIDFLDGEQNQLCQNQKYVVERE